MRETIVDRMAARFASFDDLLGEVDKALIDQRIDLPKHKSLGEHLWCLVGARESYATAIERDEPLAFACSMTTFEHADFVQKLQSSSRAVLSVIEGVTNWTQQRDELLATLAEHEVMHEGQIIRHLYALERRLPESVRWG